MNVQVLDLVSVALLETDPFELDASRDTSAARFAMG